ERAAVFADHHGVDNEGAMEARGFFGYCFDDSAGSERAGFDGCRRDVLDDGADLLAHQLRGDTLDAIDADGGLDGQERDDRGSGDAEWMKGFEVRRDARAAAGVRAGNGEGDGERHDTLP